MKKRLYRSKTDKKLCGVCAGVADYFGIDPTIVRVIWALLAFFYGNASCTSILFRPSNSYSLLIFTFFFLEGS